MSDNLRTVSEQAELWRRAPGFVRGLIREGKLKAIKVSERGWRITPAAADAYLAEQTAKAEQPAEIDPATKAARSAMASKMGKASAAARAARREAAGPAVTPLPKVKKVKCKPAAAKGGA